MGSGLLRVPERGDRHAAAAWFWLVVVATSAAYALLLWRQMRYGLEFDEAYNLTVAKNLATGHGYASDGVFRRESHTQFDPFVSTGPVLLMPAGAVWWLSGGALWVVRLVPIAFFGAYLGVVARVGWRCAGRWGALAAVASPLLMVRAGTDLSTFSLVPGRLVGEFAAVALLVCGAEVLARPSWGRCVVAGLLFGCAVQTKYTFIAPAAVVILVFLIERSTTGLTLRRAAAAVGALVIPTAAFETYRLAVVGPGGYGQSIVGTVEFLGGQAGPGRAGPVERLTHLLSVLSPWGWSVVLLGLVVVAVALRSGTWRIDPSLGADRGDRVLLIALALAGLTMLALWLLVSTQDSVRQGLPTLLLGLPCLGMVIAMAVLTTSRARRPHPSAGGPDVPEAPNGHGDPDVSEVPAVSDGRALPVGTRVLVSLLAVLTVMAVAEPGFDLAGDRSGELLLTQQRRAAAAIEGSGTPSLPVRGRWQLPEFQVLTDLPPSTDPSVGPATIKVYTSIEAASAHLPADARALSSSCKTVLVAQPAAVVCR